MTTEIIPKERKICWENASESAQANYKQTLEHLLDNIYLPVTSIKCSDLKCKNHQEEMEEYTMAVLEAIEQAGKLCLASTGGSKSTRKYILPG